MVDTQHCGYWCPGAKAPDHQYPQRWLIIHCSEPVSAFYKKCSIYTKQQQKTKSHFCKKDPVV